MTEKENVKTYMIKTLYDEEGKPFAPVTSYDALINEQGTSLEESLQNKVDFEDIVSGQGITVTTEGEEENKKVVIRTDIDYNDLDNKPAINGVLLEGGKSLDDLSIQKKGDYATNSRVTSLEKELDEIVDLAKGANQAIGYNSYQQMIEKLLPEVSTDPETGEEVIIPTENPLNVGQSIFIKTEEVLDVWIYKNNDEPVIYNYTTDEQVQLDLQSENGLKVGVYTLYPLETGKMNLTNYVQFTDIASDDTPGVIKVQEGNGLIIADGAIATQAATEAQINLREDRHAVITPSNLQKAVKSIVSKLSDLENDMGLVSGGEVSDSVAGEIEAYIVANEDRLKGDPGVYVGPEKPLDDSVRVWVDTDDVLVNEISYATLSQKPTIDGIELNGDLTKQELGMATLDDINAVDTDLQTQIDEVKTSLETKQGLLTAGTNITIDANNKISTNAFGINELANSHLTVGPGIGSWSSQSIKIIYGDDNFYFIPSPDNKIYYFDWLNSTNTLVKEGVKNCWFLNHQFIGLNTSNNCFTISGKTSNEDYWEMDSRYFNYTWSIQKIVGEYFYCLSEFGYGLRTQDFKNWEEISYGLDVAPKAIAKGKDYYLMIGYDNCVFKSENGTDWIAVESQGLSSTQIIQEMEYYQNKFWIGVCDSGSTLLRSLYTSADGTSWSLGYSFPTYESGGKLQLLGDRLMCAGTQYSGYGTGTASIFYIEKEGRGYVSPEYIMRWYGFGGDGHRLLIAGQKNWSGSSTQVFKAKFTYDKYEPKDYYTKEEVDEAISNIDTSELDLTSYAQKADVLTVNNVSPYTPMENYNPATKKYVDDSVAGASSSPTCVEFLPNLYYHYNGNMIEASTGCTFTTQKGIATLTKCQKADGTYITKVDCSISLEGSLDTLIGNKYLIDTWFSIGELPYLNTSTGTKIYDVKIAGMVQDTVISSGGPLTLQLFDNTDWSKYLYFCQKSGTDYINNYALDLQTGDFKLSCDITYYTTEE